MSISDYQCNDCGRLVPMEEKDHKMYNCEKIDRTKGIVDKRGSSMSRRVERVAHYTKKQISFQPVLPTIEEPNPGSGQWEPDE